MQPSQGRVPWPRALPAFVAFKEAFDVAERRQDQADAAERARFAFAMILRCPRHDDGLPAELVAGNIDRQPIPLEPRMGMAPATDIVRCILVDVIGGDPQPLYQIAAEQLGSMSAGSP